MYLIWLCRIPHDPPPERMLLLFWWVGVSVKGKKQVQRGWGWGGIQRLPFFFNPSIAPVSTPVKYGWITNTWRDLTLWEWNPIIWSSSNLFADSWHFILPSVYFIYYFSLLSDLPKSLPLIYHDPELRPRIQAVALIIKWEQDWFPSKTHLNPAKQARGEKDSHKCLFLPVCLSELLRFIIYPVHIVSRFLCLSKITHYASIHLL